jgi:thioredoxin-like negative regulator of GroEL
VDLVIFGKKGCKKCDILKKRVEALLSSLGNDWGMQYRDVTQEDDLVQFCKTEVLNPQRIPALLVFDNGQPICYDGEKPESKEGQVFTPVYLGLYTDYDTGTGTLSPEVIKAVVDIALLVKGKG